MTDINVPVFTQSTPVWQIQGHALHPYIMVNAAVPWFDPIPPIGHCYIIRDVYLYAHTSTWSTLVLTPSIYHWVRPYRPLSRKQRLHLIFDTDPQLGMIPKFFFKPYLRRNLTYSCNQNFFLLFKCVKSRITRHFLLL
jgi:hypothetical protein